MQLSYRLATVLQVLGILFSVAAFYFVARVLGPAASPYLAEYGGNYFAFVLVGIAFAAYQAVGLFAFTEAIRSGQTQGTLEALLVTPTRLETILATSALWSFLQATLQVVAYLLVGAFLFGAPLGRANIGTALLALLLSLLAFSGLGILSASVILVTKRGDPVNFLFASLSALLSGVYYPVGVLPAWLQPLSTFLPLTHALRAMRLALLEGAGLAQVAPELALLALFAAVVLPGGLLAFRWALRRARAEGSLTQY
jgi:ABC-2 type transport system permease protein